uniref:Uncharacterized protein n=1 Tax=Theileria annulata TaxID=5874 RepID=A0A3B0MV46_THEAN
MTQLQDSVKKVDESSERVSQRVRDAYASKDETERSKEQYPSRDKKSDDSPSESSERSSRDKSRDTL